MAGGRAAKMPFNCSYAKLTSSYFLYFFLCALFGAIRLPCRPGHEAFCARLAGHVRVICHHCDIPPPLRYQDICWLHHIEADILCWTGADFEDPGTSECKQIELPYGGASFYMDLMFTSWTAI